MRLLTQSAKFRQAIIVAIFGYGLLIWAAAQARKSTGRESLKIEVAGIRSNISEAAQILDAAEAGRLTSKYFHDETELLHGKLIEATKNLGSVAPKAELEAAFTQARGLAESAANELNGVSTSLRDESGMDKRGMERTRTRLEEIFGQAVALEKSLNR